MAPSTYLSLIGHDMTIVSTIVNNSVSPIGRRSSQTHFPIKNCLSRKRRNGWESRTRLNFPDHRRRRGQMFPYVCNRAQTDRRPIADLCRSYGNQALVSCGWSWQSQGSLIPGKFDLKINRSMKTPWQEYSAVAYSY